MSGRITLAAAFAAVLVAPLVVPTYHALLMLPFMAYAVVLLGLNLLFGYTGLVSFGHALFVGLGAYAGAFLTGRFGVRSFEVMLLTAALLGALVAAPVGALCVRYVKIYFGMLTLAFGMVFYTFLLKFYRLTGGDEGMPVLRPLLLGRDLGGIPKTDYLVGPYYYYALGVLVVAGALMWRVVHSPFGLCLRTIRDNPAKAETLGISVAWYRWYAFVISAVYAAVGGALLGPPTGNVDPTLVYWTHSGNMVFMTLLGGFSSFFGPVLGAFVFIYLQDFVMSVVPYWRLIFGAMLAVIVIFAPGGLMGLFALRPAKARPASSQGTGETPTISTQPTHAGGGRADLAPTTLAPTLPATTLPARALPARTILRADNVRKLYGEFCALDGVTLSIDDGEFVSIIGPNGAGKSTLINVLTGTLRPTAGRVHFNGRDITGVGPARLARLGMARSFQLVQIFPDLTVLETLQAAVVSRLRRGTRMLGSLAHDRAIQHGALELAELFDFGDKLHVPARHLAQGDKKLLDIASAFALRPEIILLDEPTSGVSTADKTAIMETLVSASKQVGLRAIIQVEHDMDIVFGYSDRIIALHQGKVLADAPPETIRADVNLVDMVIGRGAVAR